LSRTLNLINKFERADLSFLKKNKVFYVSSKKEAKELYNNFKENFELMVEFFERPKPKVENKIFKFKVRIDSPSNFEVLQKMCNFSPKIYFSLEKLDYNFFTNEGDLFAEGYILIK
jgi:hypothetical protein